MAQPARTVEGLPALRSISGVEETRGQSQGHQPSSLPPPAPPLPPPLIDDVRTARPELRPTSLFRTHFSSAWMADVAASMSDNRPPRVRRAAAGPPVSQWHGKPRDHKKPVGPEQHCLQVWNIRCAGFAAQDEVA
eukprot:m.261721 g.261721  ORF g.261721 m.261721 type:complete len:135 (+) comp24827_c0_seq1:284-688(+)